MTLRLRPAVREEEALGIGCKDMRHAPAVPENLGRGKRLGIFQVFGARPALRHGPSGGLGASGARLRHRIRLLAAGCAEEREENEGDLNNAKQNDGPSTSGGRIQLPDGDVLGVLGVVPVHVAAEGQALGGRILKSHFDARRLGLTRIALHVMPSIEIVSNLEAIVRGRKE